MRHVIEEIGSEFWIDDRINTGNDLHHDFKKNGFYGDRRLLLSGRTAIDYICHDIRRERKVSTVYMPV